MTRITIVTLCIACFLTVNRAPAQTGLASVQGRVTDTSGAIVIGAQVEIKNTATNEASPRTTDLYGLYTFTSLRPGRYAIRAQKTGFKAVTVAEFNLNVGDIFQRNITLEVGDVSESITVTGEAEKLNTTDGSVSTVIERQMVEN